MTLFESVFDQQSRHQKVAPRNTPYIWSACLFWQCMASIKTHSFWFENRFIVRGSQVTDRDRLIFPRPYETVFVDIPVWGTIASDSSGSESGFQILLGMHCDDNELSNSAGMWLSVQHLLNCRFASFLVSHLLAFATAQGKYRTKALFPQWYSELAFHSFDTCLSVSVTVVGSSAIIRCTSSSLSVWKGSRKLWFRGRGTLLGVFSLDTLFSGRNLRPNSSRRLAGGTYAVSSARKVSNKGVFRCLNFCRFADMLWALHSDGQGILCHEEKQIVADKQKCYTKYLGKKLVLEMFAGFVRF